MIKKIDLYKNLIVCAFFLVAFFKFYSMAFADNCTVAGTPVNIGVCSSAGEWGWDTTNSSYYFCNGSNKISLKGTGTLGSCAGFTVSELDYDSANTTFKYCDGTNWVPFNNGGASGSCSTAGQINYNTSSNLLLYCDGTNWINSSETSGGGATGKCVFVTATKYFGSGIGGQSGANAKCEAEKGALTGTYEAWIGESNPNDPQSDFNQSTTPYIRPDGVQVASDWTDLTDGTLQNPINIDASGAVANAGVWTNVNTDGTTQDTIDCLNWGSPTSNSLGRWGWSYSATSTWTDAYFNDGFTNNCRSFAVGSDLFSLYCFEQ